MMQIELDNLSLQLKKSMAISEDLRRISLDRQYERVAFGALVKTSTMNYFISSGFGKVNVEALDYYAISPESPIGQILMDKQEGQHLEFNGRTFTIESIQ